MEPTQSVPHYPEFNEPTYLQPPPPPPDNRRVKTLNLILLGLILVIMSSFVTWLLLGGLNHPKNTALNSTLATTTLTPSSTPTPTLSPLPPYTYFAPIPGPGCDSRGGIWQMGTGQNALASCSKAGLVLTQPANTNFVTVAFFLGPQRGYGFPASYTVSIHISALLPKVCAGILTHQQKGFGGYGFYICSNGFWYIDIYRSSDGQNSHLATGNTIAGTSYDLQVGCDEAHQDFVIDGSTVYGLDNATYLSTAYVGLALDENPNSPDAGLATFSNFAYTPT